MGGGGQQKEPGVSGGRGGSAGGVYTWEEVQKHCHRTDKWLVINRKVYNITEWAKRHPGGIRVISHYAGEDATVPIRIHLIYTIYIYTPYILLYYTYRFILLYLFCILIHIHKFHP